MVQPKSIRLDPIQAGAAQEVLFAGFTKGEPVTATLDSAPLADASVKADSDGFVKVDFKVPATTASGTHLLRVLGQTSKISGVASFQVIAAPASSAPASSAASSVRVSAVASTRAPVSSAVLAPVVLSTSSSSSAATSAAIAPLTPLVTGSSSSKPVWLWYVLGAVVALWAGFAIYMVQRRRSRLAAEMRDKETTLGEGAAAEQQRTADAILRANSDAPTAYVGTLGTPGTIVNQSGAGYQGYHPGEHGLLSGRDNPENPGLLAGKRYRPDSTADIPITYQPGTPNTGPSGAAGTGSAGDSAQLAGPATGLWRPDFSSAGEIPPVDAGPGTAQWRPDFETEVPPETGRPGGRHGLRSEDENDEPGPLER